VDDAQLDHPAMDNGALQLRRSETLAARVASAQRRVLAGAHPDREHREDRQKSRHGAGGDPETGRPARQPL
jgi:hypothetical protein